MATNIIIVPMTNVIMDGDYTGQIQVGNPPVNLAVTLDSGSSALGIATGDYNPTSDSDAQTTDLVQSMSYGSGSWFGSVVETTVTIGVGSSQASLAGCQVGVAVSESQTMFGKTGGILGLAYIGLDDAFEMPGTTWPLTYDVGEIKRLGKASDAIPFFSQLTKSQNIAQMFGFYSLRSMVRVTGAGDPASDPFNQGWLILGGGPASTNLFTGSFQDAKVVGEDWYDTNLTEIRVGNQPPIAVAPFLKVENSLTVSNSVIDTGTNSLRIATPYYTKMVSAFTAINPEFGTAIQQAGLMTGKAVSNSILNLPWPTLSFVFEGLNGDVVLDLAPSTYWQTDAGQAGAAIFMIAPTDPPQSILGLPLLNNYFTVFNQTIPNKVSFASIVQPAGASLPQP